MKQEVPQGVSPQVLAGFSRRINASPRRSASITGMSFSKPSDDRRIHYRISTRVEERGVARRSTTVGIAYQVLGKVDYTAEPQLRCWSGPSSFEIRDT